MVFTHTYFEVCTCQPMPSNHKTKTTVNIATSEITNTMTSVSPTNNDVITSQPKIQEIDDMDNTTMPIGLEELKNTDKIVVQQMTGLIGILIYGNICNVCIDDHNYLSALFSKLRLIKGPIID